MTSAITLPAHDSESIDLQGSVLAYATGEVTDLPDARR